MFPTESVTVQLYNPVSVLLSAMPTVMFLKKSMLEPVLDKENPASTPETYAQRYV
jgi:hypothetical protein